MFNTIIKKINLVKYHEAFKTIERSGLFDRDWYEANYPDVKNSRVNPLMHYIKFGWHENRNPSQTFDTNLYLSKYPELKQNQTCPLLHYINTIIPIQVINLIKPFDFHTIYELGNKKTDSRPYSIYYNSLGKEYTSIDLNGLDGALTLDLCSDIDLPSRDVVFNIGTSEHVVDQKQVFLNIHNLSHHRMIHWVPFESKHKDHGMWGYNEDFFMKLAELNNYKIEKLYIEKSFKNWTLVCCSLKKQNKHSKFIWDEKLPLCYNEEGSFGISMK